MLVVSDAADDKAKDEEAPCSIVEFIRSGCVVVLVVVAAVVVVVVVVVGSRCCCCCCCCCYYCFSGGDGGGEMVRGIRGIDRSIDCVKNWLGSDPIRLGVVRQATTR